jgi:hypothetical protein
MLILKEAISRIGAAYGNYPRWAEFIAGWAVIIALFVASILLSRATTREAK